MRDDRRRCRGRACRAHRVEARADRGGRDPPDVSGRRGGRPLHRSHRLDAHLLPRQDVDHRPRLPAETPPSPPHPGEPSSPLVHDRHGLHESEPSGARGPRVRPYPGAHRCRPQDRDRARLLARRVPPHHGLDAGRRRTRRVRPTAPRPLRGQHAGCRGHRRRQGRGPVQVRHVRQHLRRERVGGGRGRRGRQHRPGAHRGVRGPVHAGSRAAPRQGAPRVPAVRGPDRGRIARISPPAASPRSPPTSKTWAACGSCPVSRSSG